MGSIDEDVFTAAPELVTAQGLLFDFDGTIIDSTDAIVKYWHRQAKEINVDPEVILATSHGRRSIDMFRILAPEKANWDYICREEESIPLEYGRDAVEIPGARNLLASLDTAEAPWALVTSGTRPLVKGWLKVLRLARPKHVVTAEDVEEGKPDPAGYLLGQQRLGFAKGSDMVVFEDAPAGILAGKAAGFKVVGLATTHSVSQIKQAEPDWIVQDLRSVTLKEVKQGRVQIEIKDALVK